MWGAKWNGETRLYVINTISKKELDSMANNWMCRYKEFVHPTHVWINFNTSTHDMTGK